MSEIRRKAAPGNFFGVIECVDSADYGERYTSISMDYTPHSVVSVAVSVRRGDWIEAFANGQIDNESVTNVIEVCQQLKFYRDGAWYEIGEETGVNIGARSSANIAAHLDRHHEDFAASGVVLDLDGLNLPTTWDARLEVHWFFRAQNGGTSAPVPADSARLVVKVYREFRGVPA
jgi:hypothetical protein